MAEKGDGANKTARIRGLPIRKTASFIMKFIIAIWMAALLIAACPPAGAGQQSVQAPGLQPENASPGLDEILARVEERYSVSGFSARFFQMSVLKAMDIKDTARGKIYIKRPGKMRWEYEEPERQIIISDGYQLWIFRPEDNQVMIGKAPDFFGDGKGASFLSDVRKMRENFKITLENRPDTDNHILKLLPRRKGMDISHVILSVSWTTFDIEEIVTYNAYGDETRITLSDMSFHKQLDDDLFSFIIPEGVEVLRMEQ